MTATAMAKAMAFVCLTALALFHLRQIAAASIHYDDAVIANVAKNLAFGFGYSTSYPQIVPFDPEASTGPVVVLPAAALVRIFGNRYWVPTFSIVACIWTSLTLVLLLLRSSLAPRDWFAITALIAFGLLLYHADEFGLLGDVPAALLAVASTVILCQSGRGESASLIAGLLLGLAIETKLYAALMLGPAFGRLSLASAEGERDGFRHVREWLAFTTGVLVPVVSWQVCQFVGTGFSVHEWVGLNARQYAFFEAWSGARIFRPHAGLLSGMPGHIASHVSALVGFFDGWLPLVLFPAALAVGVGAIVLRPADGPQSRDSRRIVVVLLTAALIHGFWWLTLELESEYRHLLPAVVYLLVTAAVATVSSVRASRVAGAVAVVLLMLGVIPRLPYLALTFGRFEPEPRLTALLATRDEMMTLQSNPDVVFVGYGWWVPRDLEYLMPTVGNFKDALRLQPADVKRKKIVLVRNEFFNWDRSPAAEAFQAACDRQIVFVRHPFIMSTCPGLPGAVW